MLRVEPVVSVICPVYNAESYLLQCVDSILTQTFTNFELILINDGSTDRSGEICDYYAENNNKVSVVHQRNKGVNAARKVGIEHSLGQWIFFMDSDDSIPSNALELLIDASKEDIDIVVGNILYEGKKQIFKIKCCETLTSESFICRILEGRIHSGPVAKIFRRRLFANEVFALSRDVVYAEDLIANIRVAKNAVQIMTILPIVYNYRRNSSSISQNFIYTVSYGKKIWDIVDKDLFHISERIEKAKKIFLLNVFKHICASRCFKYDDEFIRQGLSNISYWELDRLKDLVWLTIMRNKLLYKLYLHFS